MDKREQILKGISKWIDSKVDELAGNNILMALAANPIKRVGKEWLRTVIPIDMLELLLSNHGVIDAQILANEVIEAINNAPIVEKEFNGIMLRLKDRVISVELPSNSIVKGLLNGDNVLNFRESDIRELAQFINESKNE